MKLHIIIIIFTLLASFSWVVLSYDRYARPKGWPVSRWYEESTSLIKIASFVSLPGSALASAYLIQWWSAFLIIIFDYCEHYNYSFSEEEVKNYLSDEEWWFERFGEDPLWGKG